MTEKSMFGIGDVVVSDDKRSVLFRRDSVVVYADNQMFSLVTEGLSDAFFFDSTERFHAVSTGNGKLSDEQMLLLRGILAEWPYVGILSKFPDLVSTELQNLGIDSKDMEPITIMATVPRKLAFFYRQQHAALMLARHVLPQVPQDVEQLLAQWAMLSAVKIGAAVHGPDILRRVLGQGQ